MRPPLMTLWAISALALPPMLTFTPMSYFATDATGTRVKPMRLVLGCMMVTTLATCAASILVTPAPPVETTVRLTLLMVTFST